MPKRERKNFKIQESGYKYYLENLKPISGPKEPEKRRPGKQLAIPNLKGKALLFQNPGMALGTVKKVIGLDSEYNKLQQLSLKECVKLRMENREKAQVPDPAGVHRHPDLLLPGRAG